MKTAPYEKFGRTLDVRLVTWTDNREDEPPRDSWSATLWVERGEDMYELTHYRGQTVRLVYRRDWLLARERADR